MNDDKIKLEAKERTLKITLKRDEIHKIYRESSKNGLFERFMTVNQEMFLYFTKCKLNGTDNKIIYTLLGFMEKENLSYITQKGLSNYLKMSRQVISKSLKKLKKLNIVITDKLEFSEKENTVAINLKFFINRAFAIKSSQYDKEYNDWHTQQAVKECPETVKLNPKLERKKQIYRQMTIEEGIFNKEKEA